jgi:ABC-type multidrug transport system ATPase subunit
MTVHGNSKRKTALVSEVVQHLSASGIRFRDLRTEQSNLEDVFLKMTGRAMKD